jgi:hypothetical protein
MKQYYRLLQIACLLTAFAGVNSVAAAEAIVANHTSVAEFGQIPGLTVSDIATNFRIFYGHTSHGSQLMTGMAMVETENAAFAEPYVAEYGDDLGTGSDTTWVPITRNYLNSNSDITMVVWSWCGGQTTNTEADVNVYLNAMSQLETAYPGVVFVYMTGHLDGTGSSGNLYLRNNQIRTYCAANDKVLFDFADIESYSPAGTYYPNESDACGWCTTWCSSNTCPTCADCAHSHCFNCYLKGKAFWWLMATVAGWSPAGVDDPQNSLPETFRLGQNYPNPFNPATTISYTVPRESQVTLEVLNTMGQHIATLVDQRVEAGEHSVQWRADNVASGVYVYRLRADGLEQTRKMLLLK